MSEPYEVDSWRFLPRRLADLLRASIESSPPAASVPFTPLAQPLRAAKVALLSTGGISHPPDPPFDMDGERANPLWGDPSWRRIPAATKTGEVEVNHLHIDTTYIREDLNVALPLDRLRELVEAGEVGGMAETHYSVMGFQPDQKAQLAESAPAIADSMRADGVTAAVFAPV